MIMKLVDEIWYNHFMKVLFAKYPKRAQLLEALMHLLQIEREAAYRRLRKDVPFAIQEIVKISAAWHHVNRRREP